jgi:transposase
VPPLRGLDFFQATAFNVCARIAARWIRRYQLEGSAGLQDRSSRPHSLSTAYGEALARRVRARLHGFHIAQIQASAVLPSVAFFAAWV